MDGKAHDLGTVLLASLGGYTLSRLDPTLGIAFGVGALVGGVFLSPDIDLEYSRPSRRWGALSLLWAPYRSFHPHRGLSHTYLYGPLSRLVYTGFLALLLLFLGYIFPSLLGLWEGGGAHLFFLLGEWIKNNPELSLSTLGGYMASQWLHLLMDGILPRFRRKTL